MRKFSEGTKMWISVMAAFLIYAVVFILFDDYDRKMLEPLNQVNDWHLMVFGVVVWSQCISAPSIAAVYHKLESIELKRVL